MYIKLHNLMDKKCNETHENLIPTTINNHIIQYKLLYIHTTTNINISCNQPIFLSNFLVNYWIHFFMQCIQSCLILKQYCKKPGVKLFHSLAFRIPVFFLPLIKMLSNLFIRCVIMPNGFHYRTIIVHVT